MKSKNCYHFTIIRKNQKISIYKFFIQIAMTFDETAFAAGLIEQNR